VAVQRISAIKLQNLKPPATGVAELWDAICRGLCLRVFPSGKATWTYRYRPRDGGARRRVRLGEFPSIGLAEARKRADRERGDVADGADPQAERKLKRNAPTLAAVIERYLTEEVDGKKKPGTVVLYKNYLRNLLGPSLTAKKAAVVTRGDVGAVHREIGDRAPVAANRAIVALSGVYAFAGRHGLVSDGFNPARGIEKFREQTRERYLSVKELGRLGSTLRLAEIDGLPWPSGEATSKHERKSENRKTVFPRHVVAAFHLLLFTGCRLNEILRLRWNEVDVQRGLLLLPDSKTGKKAVVLNAPALQILVDLPRVGDFVIPGDRDDQPRADLKRPWDLVRHHAGLEGVRIHDLRHTHASIGVGAGMGLPIIGALLGHKNSETTARYAHLDSDPLRRASDRIGGLIAASLGRS
jgi:integrase